MQVKNLSNIAEALKAVSKEGKVTLVIDTLKKRDSAAVGKVGDVYFQLSFDSLADGIKAGRSVELNVETGEAVLLDVPVQPVTKAIEPTSRPGRSCSSRISNKDMM